MEVGGGGEGVGRSEDVGKVEVGGGILEKGRKGVGYGKGGFCWWGWNEGSG